MYYIFDKSLYHSTSCMCCRRDLSSHSTVLLRSVFISLVPPKILYFYFEYDDVLLISVVISLVPPKILYFYFEYDE